MPDAKSVAVLCAELESHARNVNQVRSTVATSADAANQVTPGIWDNAYGVLCQYFSVGLRPIADVARQTIQNASDSLDSAENELNSAAESYCHVDDHVSRLFQKILDELGSGTMSPNNPQVDKHSKFNPDEYLPTPHSPSPITSGGDWLSGSGIVADSAQVLEDIKNQDWVDAYLDSAPAALDEVAAIQDPLGTVASAALGWILDHLKPLRLTLDELTGNPDTVYGVAQTWQNIHQSLNAAAKNYGNAVKDDIANWEGPAAVVYRLQAGLLEQTLEAASTLADGMSVLIRIAGDLVKAVRNFVRDTLANLYGELISDLAQEAATAGFATPGLAEEALGAIDRETSLVMKVIKALVKTLTSGLSVAGRIYSLFQEILKRLQIPQRIGKFVPKIDLPLM